MGHSNESSLLYSRNLTEAVLAFLLLSGGYYAFFELFSDIILLPGLIACAIFSVRWAAIHFAVSCACTWLGKDLGFTARSFFAALFYFFAAVAVQTLNGGWSDGTLPHTAGIDISISNESYRPSPKMFELSLYLLRDTLIFLIFFVFPIALARVVYQRIVRRQRS